MKFALVRHGLLQTTLVVYSVLGVGVILKCVYGLEVPPDTFATKIRDYGFLLLLIPAAWSIWATWKSRLPATDHWDLIRLFDSGNAVALVLFIIAFAATMSASAPLMRVMYVVKPTPKLLHSAHHVVVE